MQKTICSVYFDKCGPSRRNFGTGPNGGLTTFEMEAVPRGEHRTMRVGDMFQREYVGNKLYMGVPEFGENIANDLVHEWAEAVMLARFGGPGVFVCLGDEPTEAELSAARTKQLRWCRALLNKAQGDWIRGNRDHIHEGSIFHKAAEWMGETYEWMRPAQQTVTQKCPWCGVSVPGGVAICLNCKNVIDPVRLEQLRALDAKLAPPAAAEPEPEADDMLPEPEAALAGNPQ